MDDNKYRKLDQYRRSKLLDEVEEDRLRRERWLLDGRYAETYNER